METIYVNKRSDVTAEIDRLVCPVTPTLSPFGDSPLKEKGEKPELQIEVYRTRVNCNCTYPFNFRYGALIISNNMVTHKIVRCKQCAKGGGL